MAIRAVLTNGQIKPLDPLPRSWHEGQELLVEQPEQTPADVEIERWAKEVEEAAARIPPEDHERLQRALEEIERESKEAVRREWGLE